MMDLVDEETTRGPVTSRLCAGEHEVVISGLKFRYWVCGNGPLLVVQAPGWGIGAGYLRHGLAPLEKEFTLLLYDPRGNGSSSRPANELQMSTSEMVDDLEHLRQYWGLESISLLGHSSGGATAIGYAERYPEHLNKLILVDSSLPGYDSSTIFKGFIEARMGDKRYQSSIEQLRQPIPHTDEAFLEHLVSLLPFYFYNPTKNVPLLLKTMTDAPSAWTFHASIKSDKWNPMEQLAAVSEVQASTLILVGAEDPFCPVAVSGRIHASIAGSKLIVLEETGHFPWIEQPHRFFACVRDHLFE
jgi:proline iminopeptidase